MSHVRDNSISRWLWLCIVALSRVSAAGAATLTTSVVGSGTTTFSGNPVTFTARATDSGGAGGIQGLDIYVKPSAAASSDFGLHFDLVASTFFITISATGYSSYPRTPIVVGTQTISLTFEGITVSTVTLAKSGNNVDGTVTVTRDTTNVAFQGDKVIALGAFDGTIYSQPGLTTPAATWALAGGGTDSSPPSAPGSVVASAQSASQINLNWVASTDNVGVVSYVIERCAGVGCSTFAQVGPASTPGYADSGLTAGTSYSYRVKALDAANNASAYSATATAVPSASAGALTFTYDDAGRLVRTERATGVTIGYALDPAGNRTKSTTSDGTTPSLPTGLTITPASPTQLNLSWTAATDNVAVTGYIVEQCQGAGCISFAAVATLTGAPPATVYQNTGLTSTTAYSYRIRATDALGNVTSPSAIASATTLDGTSPTPPAALTATPASATAINLSWTASSDNIGVTGYAIERCANAGCAAFTQMATVTGTPPLTVYANTGLSQVTTYQYRVRAYDARTNYSGYSNSAAAMTLDGTAPSVPTALTATTVSSTRIDLGWIASTDNVGVTTYLIERCPGAGCTSFVQIAAVSGAPPAVSLADTGLTPSATYRYEVRAGDAAGNLSGYSSIVTGTTASGVPSTPSLTPINLTTHSTTISLIWTASAGATSYQVYSSPDDTTYGLFNTTPSTGITFTTGNGDHYYRVTACNVVGCSAQSNRSHILVCPVSGCL